jgi:hypothetical protein
MQRGKSRFTRHAVVTCAWLAASDPALAAQEPVTEGPVIDYQPSVIRSTDDGARIVVFERLDPSTLSGDLWLTRLEDAAMDWSDPVPIIASTANERHPALLQLGASDYVLFYLSDAGGGFRIHRATSSDAVAFTEHGAVDLSWATTGEINPHVIRHADGTLTMSYQRLSPGGSYVAQSVDEGATWDTLQTPIANGVLPRIAYRESDGLYLASYQVNPGNDDLRIYVETTADVQDWSGTPQDFAVTGNNHDSLPVVMPDGAFVLFWIRSDGGPFDIASRRSRDGENWQSVVPITLTPGSNDVEPHPLVGALPGMVEVYWGSESPPGSFEYHILRDPAVVVVADLVFSDSFGG